jgi:Na+/phosphate symporter
MDRKGESDLPWEQNDFQDAEANVVGVDNIISDEREKLSQALVAAVHEETGSVANLEQEIRRYTTLGGRVSSTVRELEISEPTDKEFIMEMMQILEKLEQAGEGIADPYTQRQISVAVQHLQRRNAVRH